MNYNNIQRQILQTEQELAILENTLMEASMGYQGYSENDIKKMYKQVLALQAKMKKLNMKAFR